MTCTFNDVKICLKGQKQNYSQMRGKDFFVENTLLDCLLAIRNLRKRTFFIEVIELDDEGARAIFKAVTRCQKKCRIYQGSSKESCFCCH